MQTKLCGIYYILNTATGKYYVGSSVDINSRFRTHRNTLRRSVHHNAHLQSSWNMHGEASFTFGIAESIEDPANLKRVEQVWINHFGGYNLAKSAERPGLGRLVGDNEKRLKRERMSTFRHSNETKQKLSDLRRAKPIQHSPAHLDYLAERAHILAQDPTRREKVSQLQKGRKRSPATVERMRTALTGKARSAESVSKQSVSVSGAGNHRFGVRMSDETKQRISETKRARAAERKRQKENPA